MIRYFVFRRPPKVQTISPHAPKARYARADSHFISLRIRFGGLTLIARMRGRHFARGLMAGLFGLLLGTAGLSAHGTMGRTA